MKNVMMMRLWPQKAAREKKEMFSGFYFRESLEATKNDSNLEVKYVL